MKETFFCAYASDRLCPVFVKGCKVSPNSCRKSAKNGFTRYAFEMYLIRSLLAIGSSVDV